MNFRSAFTPAKPFTFSNQKLQFLMTKCAEFLTSIIKKIHSNPGATVFGKRKRTKFVSLPDVFGSVELGYTVLPLAYHSPNEPDQNCMCDLPNCTTDNLNQSWKLFDGCGHSFNHKCLAEAHVCPLCQKFLSDKIADLLDRRCCKK